MPAPRRMPFMQRKGRLVVGNAAQVFVVRTQRFDTFDTGDGFYCNLRKELGIWCFAAGQ